MGKRGINMSDNEENLQMAQNPNEEEILKCYRAEKDLQELLNLLRKFYKYYYSDENDWSPNNLFKDENLQNILNDKSKKVRDLIITIKEIIINHRISIQFNGPI